MKQFAYKVGSLLLAVVLLCGLTGTALAAKDISIKVKWDDGPGYVIPGVIETISVKANRDSVRNSKELTYESFWLFSSDDGNGMIKVYKVPINTTIGLAGLSEWMCAAVEMENGELIYKDNSGRDFTGSLEVSDEMDSSNVFKKDAKITFLKDGYYAFTASPNGDGLDQITVRGDASCILMVGNPKPLAPAAPIAAKATASKVMINGSAVAFEAYNIQGNNYFKLRDVAMALSGSPKQFDVTWDGAQKVINLLSEKAYTAVGGELAPGDGKDKLPTATKSAIQKDGAQVALTAYTIEGNNYFKLRDLGQAFDFGVSFDDASRTIAIDTSVGYTPG